MKTCCRRRGGPASAGRDRSRPASLRRPDRTAPDRPGRPAAASAPTRRRARRATRSGCVSAGSSRPNSGRQPVEVTSVADFARLTLQLVGIGGVTRIARKAQRREGEARCRSDVAIGRRPGQRVLRQRGDASRLDPTAPERVDPRLAVVPRVIGHQVAVGGDHGAQELAEFDVHRRAVVDRADADRQKLAAPGRGLVGHRVLQVDWRIAGRQHAGARRSPAARAGPSCGGRR